MMEIKQDQAHEKLFAKLERILLGHGGQRVVRLPVETHLEEMIANGKLMNRKVKRLPGEPNRCHTNAAGWWCRNLHEYKLVTGYALAGDGLWRQHSWVTDNKYLYETTVKAKRYFGVVLGDKEALKFWWENYFPMYYGGILELMKQVPTWSNQ